MISNRPPAHRAVVCCRRRSMFHRTASEQPRRSTHGSTQTLPVEANTSPLGSTAIEDTGAWCARTVVKHAPGCMRVASHVTCVSYQRSPSKPFTALTHLCLSLGCALCSHRHRQTQLAALGGPSTVPAPHTQTQRKREHHISIRHPTPDVPYLQAPVASLGRHPC